MSCNCKNGSVSEEAIEKIETKAFGDSLYMRLIIFFISLALVAIVFVPIIIPFMVVMLFNRIVLRRGTDLSHMFLSIGKVLRTSKKRTEENDDDDYESGELDPEDYELMDVDIVKK